MRIWEEVAGKMKALLTEYNAKAERTFEDILDFHVKFERIHPFQERKRSIGQMIIKSKYQAKLKTKELDIFLFQIFLIILNNMI